MELYGGFATDIAVSLLLKSGKNLVVNTSMRKDIGLAMVDNIGQSIGEKHHVLSNKIIKELEKHNSLKGFFNRNDPKFIHKAVDKNSHTGYQKWHRDYDEKIKKWIERNDHATPEEFREFINNIYQEPEMKLRFPNVNLPDK